MGAGASSASPQDVTLLNECLNATKSRYRDDPKVIIQDLQNDSSLWVNVSSDRLDALLPVLQAAISKYSDERVNNMSHTEACEAALVAGRSVFSAGKTGRPVLTPLPTQDLNKVQEEISEFNKPLPAFPPTPGPALGSTTSTSNESNKPQQQSMLKVQTQQEVTTEEAVTSSSSFDKRSEREPTDEEKKKWRQPRPKGRTKVHRRPENLAKSAVVKLSGLRSSYEDAEIGGGTMYTTEVTLYDDGTAELGNHDIGQRGRKVHRRQRRGDGFSDALFWGGYEYYDGTWKLIEENVVNNGGGSGGGGGGVGCNRYLITLTKLSTKPSDPYSSETGQRDVSASFILTEMQPCDNNTTMLKQAPVNLIDEGGELLETKKDDDEVVGAAEKQQTQSTHLLQNENCSLILSDLEGDLHIKFKELRSGGNISQSVTEGEAEAAK
jgi:hypothetical protein